MSESVKANRLLFSGESWTVHLNSHSILLVELAIFGEAPYLYRYVYLASQKDHYLSRARALVLHYLRTHAAQVESQFTHTRRRLKLNAHNENSFFNRSAAMRTLERKEASKPTTLWYGSQYKRTIFILQRETCCIP